MDQEALVNFEGTEENNKLLSINVFRSETRDAISSLLNPKKIIPSDKGFPRDWYGLAELCGIGGEKIPSLQRASDPTNKVLELWVQKDNSGSTIAKFLSFLEDLDRYDIIEDITPLIEKDIEYFKKNPKGFYVDAPYIDDRDILTIDDISRKREGLPPQTYDAFILFADDDMNFAVELVEILEKEYNLKLCVKYRDLVGGTFEHDSVIQLISVRCGRLVVVVSPSFLESDANKFFISFAQALGIEQRRRKIIPCLYKPCENIPVELKMYFLLDYTRSGRFCNFWDKLHRSILVWQPPLEENAVKSKSLEQLKSTNHVKFDTLVISDVAHDTISLPAEEVLNPSSSYTSLEPYKAGLQKKNSIYKQLKKMFQPKSTKTQAKSDKKLEAEMDEIKINGAVEKKKKKKKLWMSHKAKLVEAN